MLIIIECLQVLEAVAQMWEVVDIIRADARNVGVEMHTPMRRKCFWDFFFGYRTNSFMFLLFAAQKRGDAEAGAVLGLDEARAARVLLDPLTSVRYLVYFIL
jgi:hypothetical protein